MFLLKKKNYLLICFILLSNLSFSQDSIYQKGLASYYSDAFSGRFTSSGEKYNNKLYTAAHATLPLHTIVKVTNLKNNKSVIVKINDRCYYSKTRIIDLSKAAAMQLDIIMAGIANINLTILDSGDLNIIKNIDQSLLLPTPKDTGKSTGDNAIYEYFQKQNISPAYKLLALHYCQVFFNENCANKDFLIRNELYLRRMICMVFPTASVFGFTS